MKRGISGLGVYLQASSSAESLHRCFTDLWRHYYPRLVVYVRSMQVVEEAEIEDAVQEVMLKILRNLSNYRPTHAVGTWVYAIARNHCTDLARARARRPPHRSLDESTSGEPRDPAPTPEGELLGRETRRLVAEALEKLSPELRQVAFLRFHEEMKHREIARALGIPVGTAKYRVHTIRARVRRALQEDDHAST